MNGVVIKKSRILRHPEIIWTIIKNVPTLDPFVIIMNAPVHVLYENNKIIGFVSVKKWKHVTELGTLYINPAYRGKGYAKLLCSELLKDGVKVSLLCKPELIPIYQHVGFEIDENPKGTMKLRKKLFDIFITPFAGYKITVMKSDPGASNNSPD